MMIEPYYSEDGITIYHGDCAEIAPQLGRFDLLCTDPPYGIGEARANHRNRNRPGIKSADYYSQGRVDWDDAPPSDELLSMLLSLARWRCIFGGNYFALPPSSAWLVWDKEKRAGIDFAHGELAWTNYGRALQIKRHLWSGYWQADMAHKEERVHPTQKPLAIMSWAISLCPERPTSVLDPFMGSGTTLVACKNLGIRAVGIEREERYCRDAVRRLAQQTLDLGAAP